MCQHFDTIMRHAVVEDSGLIFTTWGSCNSAPLKCGRRGRDFIKRPRV